MPPKANRSPIVKHLFALCLLLTYSVAVQAQVFYSTDQSYIRAKSDGNNVLAVFKNTYPDTSLDNYHQTIPLNFMGNPGLPAPTYSMQYGTANLCFRFFDLPYKNDLFTENHVLYTVSKGPYAALSGFTGAKQFQSGKITYVQSYANGLNLSFQLNRLTSQGYYLRQQTYAGNFVMGTHYQTKKKTFGFYAFVLNNGNKNQENGGIRDRVLNDSTVALNKQLMVVNVSNATHDNRQTKLMFNPWLRLFAKKDSSSPFQHFLQVKSQIDFNAYKYKDLNMRSDGFYGRIHFDSLKTIDSSNFRQFSNIFAYSVKRKDNRLAFSIGLKSELDYVWQKQTHHYLNQSVLGDLVLRSKNPADSTVNTGLESAFSFCYIHTGTYAGNYKFENNSTYYLNRAENRYFFLNALVEKRNADYFYRQWTSNHYSWNNAFAAQEQFQIQSGLNFGNNLRLTLLYQNLFKYLYLNAEAMPAQLKQSIDNFAANLQWTKVFLRHMGVSLAHTYQSTSKMLYYRVPENISTAKLFYSGSLFKNNLNVQLGTQATVYQSFKALAYMPATNSFYLQSQQTTAALPFVDVYLNARIHPVSLFLKVENLLQGFVGNNYSFVPGYYQNDRTFRCGLIWMFFD
jgi:hypothetical protein